MTRGFSRRGQPLAVLVLVLGGWVSARAMMWDAHAMPMVAQPPPTSTVKTTGTAQAPTLASRQSDMLAQAREAALTIAGQAMQQAQAGLEMAGDKIAGKFGYVPTGRHATLGAPASVAVQGFAPPAAPRAAARMARALPAKGRLVQEKPSAPSPLVFHPQPLGGGWFQPSLEQSDARFVRTGFTGLSPAIFTSASSTGGSTPALPPSRPRAKRWSMDGWYYWRGGGTSGLSQGAFAPSYGASQAGGVLRYRLAPSSGHKPSIYVRTTAALNGSYEREAALGLSARPLARLPVVLAAEGRYTTTPNGREFRPAGFAYTEMPPFPLPLGLRGELYAQGGYVGGANATPFVDGQLRIDRKLLRLSKPEVRLGGGIWGGAQKGAARLDAGPSIVITTPVKGPLSARIAADWRFRVAGDAVPDSGPAVTLSAGF